jgi:cysteine synthase A
LASIVLDPEVVDRTAYQNALAHFKSLQVTLPTFSELADPSMISRAILNRVAPGDPDDLDALNLFRVHWFNGPDRRSRVDVPAYLLLTKELTGIDAPILVLLGDRFPMIRAHKVLAAYACLVARLVTGRFDPTRDRAIWPSTGNFCRGGIAISRALGCRGVAILPEGMSRERFDWLYERVSSPDDVIATPGTESNVKEIYDACRGLAQDPRNVVFNQFSDFSNHLIHFLATGVALERAVVEVQSDLPGLRPRIFVSASGSAGTLAAGDHLKERFGTSIAAVESLECPTMLRNGYGEHNIQGIGDKHIPLIHNVMNTDFVVAVSDEVTDRLNVLFNTDVGRTYLESRRGISKDTSGALNELGLSSLCNVVASIKLARHLRLGTNDLVVTVATDGANLYSSERDRTIGRDFPSGFDEVAAAEVYGRSILGAGTGDLMELTEIDRERIFNLGYFTWVEQQGVAIDDFVIRKTPSFWSSLRARTHAWDELITSFNDGATSPRSVA